jgi:hypothetical protein
MRLGEAIRIGVALVLRAGWAPLSVFLLHVFISRVVNGYILYPPLDIPMHLFGGVAMAYFLARCFAALPEDAVSHSLRPLAEGVFVVSLTATSSVLWEFAEFTSDAVFGTQAQLGLDDTLLDMALGIAGALSYVAMTWRLGALGAVAPIRIRGRMNGRWVGATSATLRHGRDPVGGPPKAP